MRGVRSHPTAGQATSNTSPPSPSWRWCSSSPRRRWAPPRSRAPSSASSSTRCASSAVTSARPATPRRAGLAPVSAALGDHRRRRVGHGLQRRARRQVDADGHAAVGRHGGGRPDAGGCSAGSSAARPSAGLGPGAVRGRSRGQRHARASRRARGWVFPDRATAKRFLEHSLRNELDGGAGRRPGSRSRSGREVGGVGRHEAGPERQGPGSGRPPSPRSGRTCSASRRRATAR